jgi:Fe-Mn family superoxide dismutase
MPITLPPLPYSYEALAPHIKDLSFHYDKHHRGYVTNLNKLIEGTPLESQELEPIIRQSAQNPDQVGIFNNAAQVWNHTFYWNSMKPHGGGEPSGSLAAALQASFGSYKNFCDAFKQAAATQFGSGWVWLVKDSSGVVSIMKTGNADLPLIHGKKALMTCDVWEHAYYLDYQNRRPDYVTVFLDHLVNWDFASQNFEKD